MRYLVSNRKTPIEILTSPVNRLLKYKSSTGIVLFIAVIIAMFWANSQYADFYYKLWHTKFNIGFNNIIYSKDILHLINDGLMAVFFFTVGLEIKREIISGELSEPKKAVLPIGAALGGMVIPALVYLAVNHATPTAKGWGIPMATDIALTLGILSILGKKVPVSLKIFLTALAIADDLGAVLIIAFFYTSNISFDNLLIGGLFMLALILYNILGGRKTTVYALLSVGGLWLAFLLSGVHATIAGVLAAFVIPAKSKIDRNIFIDNLIRLTDRFIRSKDNNNRMATEEQHHIFEDIQDLSYDMETPLQRLENALKPFVSFIILPLFALANAGIKIQPDFFEILSSPVSIGIGLGLVLGKLIGVTGFSWILVRLKLAQLPKGTNWSHIIGIGLFAGIGFTMSLFITELAFINEEYILAAKESVLVSSTLAGITGYIVLSYFAPRQQLRSRKEKSGPQKKL